MARAKGEHLLDLQLGAAKTVIELRGLDPAFYPGHLRRGEEIRPTFLVFFAGTEDRAGTAWPHADGKGHRLKLRCDLADGVQLFLEASGFYSATEDLRAPGRHRKARHRPRINA